MKFVNVKFKDYGLYRGEVEFDFSKKHKKNTKKKVILFGGKNGAGKTTFLEAVKLCLYGKASQGTISIKDYHNFLKSKVHKSRGRLINAQYASIELTFDHAIGGETSRYKISRSWESNKGNDPHEKLRLERNGELVEDIEPEYQQEFISSIVPENLSQLFFFDGEKIQAIADDITSNAAIAESVQMLLGLDVVQKLNTDLGIFSEREAKKFATKKDKNELNHIENEIAALENNIYGIDQQLGSLKSKLDIKITRREKTQKELAVKGAAFAANLNSEKDEQRKYDIRRIEIEKLLRVEAESDFAFCLSNKINKKLLTIIERENKQGSAEKILEEINNLHQEIITNLKNSNTTKASKKVIDETINKKQIEFKELLKTQRILNNPESENYQILHVIDSSSKSKKRIKKLSKELEKVETTIHNSVRKQKRAPDEEFLKPIFNKLNKINDEINSLSEEIGLLKNNLQDYRRALEEQNRKRVKLIDLYKNIDTKNKQLQLADKAKAALAQYAEILTQMKIDQLSQSIAECFNNLIRKKSFIKEVSIDANTFQVTLFDNNENIIKRDELSSGEKQLFAISVLWALAKSSGRELPVIIDTPLGRLDSEHRINLVENYFPNAAHQVIILSTDTEVDEKLYNRLKPSVSHCYHLKYNKKETFTTSEEKYFWN